ncbi:MAG TPA: primosomal protein N' [Alphaproteobacteria bacterium]
MSIVQILPLRPVSRAYSYQVADHQSVVPGQIVRIPFGKNAKLPNEMGIVWAIPEKDETPRDKLKTCYPLDLIPPLSDALRQLIDFTAAYTMGSRGMVAKMSVPLNDIAPPVHKVTLYRLTPLGETIDITPLTAARGKVVTTLRKEKALTLADLTLQAGVSSAVPKGLIAKGLVTTEEISQETATPHIEPQDVHLPTYSAEQQSAADQLRQQVRDKKFKVTLLDGVTGSGKTEVYFAALLEALQMKKQALVLVPEITLTATFLERFEQRFGIKPIIWHSTLTPAQRRRNYQAICRGEAQVVIGARSALFLPYADLGVIVIDEEHDSSYKQEEVLFYNARDLAIKRGHLENLPVVLVSATPSLESYAHAAEGKYQWIKLPHRHAGATLPTIDTIDLRRESLNATQFLSPTLIAAVEKTLARKEQVLLYLNRRGYAPLTLCRTCGHRFECPHCTAWMVQHKNRGQLLCHHCGHVMAAPRICPQCNDEDSLVACGPGVERIYDAVRSQFPEARVVVLSSDTQKSMAGLQETLEKIEHHAVDIIIGTQIIAKGHHFPDLTLVGVVDADLGLAGGDLRASERTYQILHQVAGRAGRAEKPGFVLLQSYLPEHRVMQSLLANDRNAFLGVEAQERKDAGMPPYGRLASLIISSSSESAAQDQAQELARHIPWHDDVQVLGPAPAPLYKLRNKFRLRFLIKATKDFKIQPYITHWLEHTPKTKNARIQIDIDPYGFM